MWYTKVHGAVSPKSPALVNTTRRVRWLDMRENHRLSSWGTTLVRSHGSFQKSTAFVLLLHMHDDLNHSLTDAIAASSGSSRTHVCCNIFNTRPPCVCVTLSLIPGPHVYTSLYNFQSTLPPCISSESVGVLEVEMAIALCPCCRKGS